MREINYFDGALHFSHNGLQSFDPFVLLLRALIIGDSFTAALPPTTGRIRMMVIMAMMVIISVGKRVVEEGAFYREDGCGVTEGIRPILRIRKVGRSFRPSRDRVELSSTAAFYFLNNLNRKFQINNI